MVLYLSLVLETVLPTWDKKGGSLFESLHFKALGDKYERFCRTIS